MIEFLNNRGWGSRILRIGLLATALAGVGGCTVAVGPPPPRYYYRTRVVYTAQGPVYVRERVYYDPAYQPEPVYNPPPPTYAPPAAPVESPAAQQLQPLVAPIALYADPLIAVILPATTYPQQVQEANNWLASYPQPPEGAIDAQPWAPSIKALVHYPTVLHQLASDPNWTQSLGAAYTNQPADVMGAIQQMRAQAMAQGNLVNTQQQVIVQDGGIISIQPADPGQIYVPTYDPVVVYTSYRPLYWGPTWYATGPWLVDGVYWAGGVIFVGDWHGGYWFRDGRWGRDYGWHIDRDRYWAHDARWGAAPHVDRFAYAHGVAGRDAEIHRSMTEHAQARHEIQAGRGGAPDRGGRGGPAAGHEGGGREHEGR